MTKEFETPEQLADACSIPRAVANLNVEQIAIGDIRVNPRNARRHGRDQIDHLTAIIDRLGFIQPVLIDQNNFLIAGHGRLGAALRLGLATIPAIRISHLSDAELRALALADNRIAELSTWDEQALKIELGELSALDLDFSLPDITGFEAPVIDALVHGGDFAAPDPADEVLAAPHPGDPVARLGDVFAVGPHRLMCGDARDPEALERLFDGEKATQVLADGPYNVPIAGHVSGKGKARHREFPMGSGEMSTAQFTAFNAEWLKAAACVCHPGALIFAFMDGLHLADLIQGGREAGLSLCALCVWAKTNAGMGSLYRSQIEHIAIFKAGSAKHVNNVKLGRHGRNRTNLWSHPGMNAFGANRDAALRAHPSVKPVGLLAEAILDTSRRGDIVLDPFLGSGSTIIAAHRTGRRGYGVELDPLYIDAALDRLAAVLRIDPVRVGDGARWSTLRKAPEARP